MPWGGQPLTQPVPSVPSKVGPEDTLPPSLASLFLLAQILGSEDKPQASCSAGHVPGIFANCISHSMIMLYGLRIWGNYL